MSEAAPLRERAARTIRHPLTRTLLTLTFTTGLIDAVSYLGLGRVFTANMTGNVVLLGFGIAGSRQLPVVAPTVSLAAFAVGALGGGMLAARTGRQHPRDLATVLAIEVSLVAAGAVVAAAADVRPGSASSYAIIALLALAMGARNAVVRRIAVPDLSTTVLTMTLTGLAADSPLAGGGGAGSVRRAAAVVAMLAGAIAGALLVESSVELPLGAAAAAALAASLLYVRSARASGGA